MAKERSNTRDFNGYGRIRANGKSLKFTIFRDFRDFRDFGRFRSNSRPTYRQTGGQEGHGDGEGDHGGGLHLEIVVGFDLKFFSRESQKSRPFSLPICGTLTFSILGAQFFLENLRTRN